VSYARRAVDDGRRDSSGGGGGGGFGSGGQPVGPRAAEVVVDRGRGTRPGMAGAARPARPCDVLACAWQGGSKKDSNWALSRHRGPGDRGYWSPADRTPQCRATGLAGIVAGAFFPGRGGAQGDRLFSFSPQACWSGTDSCPGGQKLPVEMPGRTCGALGPVVHYLRSRLAGPRHGGRSVDRRRCSAFGARACPTPGLGYDGPRRVARDRVPTDGISGEIACTGPATSGSRGGAPR